jgi:hypothetical protein
VSHGVHPNQIIGFPFPANDAHRPSRVSTKRIFASGILWSKVYRQTSATQTFPQNSGQLS